MDGFAELKSEIDEIDLVDTHANNIVAIDSTLPFSTCLSGDADLAYASHTLSFKRGIKQIAELYGCKPSLQDIEDYRGRTGSEAITSACFQAAKISSILIDDGLQFDKMYDTEWHKTYVPFVGRILRVESLAEKILNQDLPAGSTWTITQFTDTFVGIIKSVANSLVALKSVAYRSSLQINPKVSQVVAEAGLAEVLSAGKPVRFTNRNFTDYLFTLSLEAAMQFDLPMQIHTVGFGDEDQDSRTANPLHLRPLLEDKRFSKSQIVLLHASYPFSREASYMASVYPQIYLHVGLTAPKLSFHGIVSTVKTLLELAPINKVILSTDGYAFPEMFYLGARNAREVVFSVLRDACLEGDLSISEAKEAAVDIFSRNAIKFYKIDQLAQHIVANDKIHELESGLPVPCNDASDTSLIRMLWVDTSGQCRCRVIPSKRFNSIVKNNGVGLVNAIMAMCAHTDYPAPGSNLSEVGEIRLIPDLSTIRKIPWLRQEEMVLADMHVIPGQAWDYCPREALRKVSKTLKDEFNLDVNAGFECEFYLLRKITRDGKEEWVPFDGSPYCSFSSLDDAAPFLQEVFSSLQSLGIPVEQLHSEAGKGQFEVALGYKFCSSAADNLIFTREVIRAVAKKHGLLATFIPKFAPDDIGSGSHVHLSLWRDGINVFMGTSGDSHHGMSKLGAEFMAGVLQHLPAILAFTTPHPNSYDRMQPNMLSGAYTCWGKENRETPLRTACPPGIPDGLVSNFEIKSFDGMANPYLGLASIIAAGIDGLRKQLILQDPIDVNPYYMDNKYPRLPNTLSGAIDSLEKDSGLFEELMDPKLLNVVKAIARAEEAYYSENKDAYKELIHRY